MRSHAKAVAAIAALLLSTLALGATLAGAAAPVVSIDPSPTASYTTAEVTGTVDPEDQETYFYFQYAIDPEAEGWTSGPEAYATVLQPGDGATAVSETLTGLKPGTEYEVRLVAENFSEPAQTISSEPNPTFTTEAVGPPTVSIDPVSEITGTSAHFSGAIDPEAPAGNPSEFDVNWHFDCVPACPNVQGGTIPADSESHTVEADATGLEPNTSYEVTLVAENIGGQQSAGPESFETDPVAPETQTLYAGQITGTSAVLAARVNPRNSPVTYQFEWGPDGSYGNVIPAAAQALGAEDNAFHVVTAPVSGLQSGQTYHFRMVATNSETSEQAAGEDRNFVSTPLAGPQGPCPNQQLREENSSGTLPDCRAYEMVSPLDKNGGDVERYFIGTNSAANTSGASALGDAVAYASRTNFGAGAETGALFPTIMSRRGPSGWSTVSLAPPNVAPGAGAGAPRLDVLSEDLSRALVNTNVQLTPAAADLNGSWGLYLRDALSAQRYTLISDPVQPLSADPFTYLNTWRFWAAAATPNLSHVVFNAACRPLVPEAPPACDQPSPDSVYVADDSGNVQLVSVLPADFPYEPLRTYAGASSESAVLYTSHPGDNVISEDAKRIFFSVDTTAGTQAFVRENGTTTRELVPGVGPEEEFYGAKASDGSVAFLKTFDGSGSALMRWDADAAPGSELSAIAPSSPGLLGFVAMSDDATRVYFVSETDLAAGAAAGMPNLYLWREGTGVSFVTTLAPADSGVWARTRQPSGNFQPRTHRVTSDGDRLLFVSRARLTAHDNAGTRQVYLYDLSLDRLICVSCGIGSDPSAADSDLFRLPEDGQWAIPRHLPRNLSSDGERVFFETAQGLVPRDANGRVDVYQWSDQDRDLSGQLALVSSGKHDGPSEFIDASESGDDVFFATRARLSPFDTDNHIDAYDARVGGGFEFVEPPAPCQGELCQGSPVLPPAPHSAATPAFHGAGNERPHKRRCGKGKVRRGKRCVTRKQAKQHRKKQSKKHKNRASHDRRTSR